MMCALSARVVHALNRNQRTIESLFARALNLYFTTIAAITKGGGAKIRLLRAAQ
jgi:hypothetical protein